MKILTCPVNGPRPIQEFHFGGSFRPLPDLDDMTDDQWADYVFNRNGEPGVKTEWWYHTASGVWFLADRNNETDDVVRTYLYQPESTDV